MPDKQFYAHSRENGSEREYQTIKEHAEGVARLSCDFSYNWCEENFAKAISFLHDVGKYQPTFQKRIFCKSLMPN